MQDVFPNLNEFTDGFRETIASIDPNANGGITGPTLDVTPMITPGGEVRMEIRPGTQLASFFYSGSFDINGLQSGVELPVQRTVTVSTTITVPDGGTILLGGILRSGETEVESGVPYLNDIPVIGDLFRKHFDDPQKKLIILITPRIIIQEE